MVIIDNSAQTILPVAAAAGRVVLLVNPSVSRPEERE